MSAHIDVNDAAKAAPVLVVARDESALGSEPLALGRGAAAGGEGGGPGPTTRACPICMEECGHADSTKRAGTSLCTCLCTQNIHKGQVHFQSLG